MKSLVTGFSGLDEFPDSSTQALTTCPLKLEPVRRSRARLPANLPFDADDGVGLFRRSFRRARLFCRGQYS